MNEINGRRKPTMAQVASATVTPAMLDGVVQNIMEGLSLIVAETVSRCLCELTLDFHNKTLSKSNLQARVDKISTVAAKATSRTKVANKQYAISEDKVKSYIRSKCFHPHALVATSHATQATASPSSQQSQHGS